MVVKLAGSLCVGAVLCGCTAEDPLCSRTYDPSGLLSALDENRVKWRSQNVTAYEYDLETVCFCGYRPARVSVKDGAVESAVHLDDGSPVDQPELDAYPTIEELFDYTEGAVAYHYDFVSATFDANLGYPTDIALDPHCDMYDEGIAYLASGLVVIGN
jgi:hypothetical protein